MVCNNDIEVSMNLAIIGTRDFNNYNLMKNTILQNYNLNEIDYIISGGAQGADYLAEMLASEFNIKIKIFKPDWKTFGRAAGPLRNIDIIKNSDFVVAFWDGKSRGTKNSIDLSIKNNKNIMVINI